MNSSPAVKLSTLAGKPETLTGTGLSVVEPLPNWPSADSDISDNQLVSRLREVFAQYPELDELYPDKQFDDAAWLCQRWLEILPMPIYEKQMLIAKQNSEAARQFLRRLIAQ